MISGDIWWSIDEENYNYESLDELLDAEWGQQEHLKEGATVYYGTIKIPSTSFVDASDIIDVISERAYEEGGEYAEDYPDYSEQDEKDLQEFITQWQARFSPRFFTIKESKEYTLTAEDVKRYY